MWVPLAFLRFLAIRHLAERELVEELRTRATE